MSPPMELDAPPKQSIGHSEDDPWGDRGGRGARRRDATRLLWDLFSARLPREIISEIFCKTCFPDERTRPSYETTTLIPLRLSHVSRLWREAALATPRLWTHLQTVVRRAEAYSALELVKLWVPRSKERPLTIDVFFKDEHGPFILYPEDSLRLFKLVTKTAALLRKELNNDLDKVYFESHVKAGSSGVLPFIEEQYLWYYGTDIVLHNEVYKGPLLVRGLRRVVDEFGFGYHEPLSTSLTKLELQDTNGVTCLSITELLVILAEFRQLRYLAAHLDHGDTPPDDQVTATKLCILKTSWAFTTDPGPLFDHLSTPFLSELELSGDVPAGAAWLHLYNFFVRSSHPPIKTVALEHFDATAGITRLAECLSSCDALESLWLENCIMDDEFIASLGRQNSVAENSVLSRLRTFGVVSTDDVSGDCLVQTLRNADTPNLKEIFVFDCAGVLRQHSEAIEDLFRDVAVEETIIVIPGEPLD